MTATTDRPIVIAAGTGFVVRNYLLGKCLTKLQERHPVVALSPMADNPGFRQVMNERGVRVEPLPAPHVHKSWGRVRRWRGRLHAGWVDNETWALKYSAEKYLAAKPDYSPTRFEAFYRDLAQWTAARLASPRTLTLIDRAEDHYALQTADAAQYRKLFGTLRPKLVFSPAPLISEEWLPIQVAREMGIPTVLSVLSWDNLSSKGRMPLPCSAFLVWSEHMRQELLAYYPDVRADQITITGPPQFDFYFDSAFQQTRAAFFASLGLDPGRPLIVYAGVTPGLMPDEPRVVEGLLAAIRSGAVPGNPQLHLRLHPKDGGERYQELRSRWPEVTFTIPGQRSGGQLKNWAPDNEDLRLLVNTVRHGDVHINVASTMTVDAAIMGRPVVNVRFDFRPPTAPRSWGLCIYDQTHYRPLLKTNGMRVAESPEELVQHVRTYLQNPTLDEAGRRKIVELVCGKVDGHSGERVATRLDELCGASPAPGRS